MVAPLQPPPPPNSLFREFESGRISREEFQAAMAEHARELIDEMEEARRNPIAAFVETMRNRRAAARLAGAYGEAAVREVLSALAEVSDFPPASLLWNAGHRHVPLFCFLRMKWAPLFRVLSMQVGQKKAEIEVEYRFGAAKGETREAFRLERAWNGRLVVAGRLRA